MRIPADRNTNECEGRAYLLIHVQIMVRDADT